MTPVLARRSVALAALALAAACTSTLSVGDAPRGGGMNPTGL